MKAVARRRSDTSLTHELEIRGHRLIADEPREHGGGDEGPTPQELLAASLASCMAITSEMYAARKGWEIGRLEVECDYSQPQRGQPTEFTLVLRVPAACTPEQLERLGEIAARCPVHRVLEGAVRFEQRIEAAALDG
jgi:putative redox protein